MRQWRRYPNRLLMWRSLADMVTALTVVGCALGEAGASSWGQHTSACTSAWQLLNPLLVQFGFFASEGWALVMALDCYWLMKDPLASGGVTRAGAYHVGVWGGAAGCTARPAHPLLCPPSMHPPVCTSSCIDASSLSLSLSHVCDPAACPLRLLVRARQSCVVG